eukprot:m.808991 g.808991  ORF g.808991 m.808991 type:complete len:99 (+) comp59316_c1_seq32:1751-2047(+)
MNRSSRLSELSHPFHLDYFCRRPRYLLEEDLLLVFGLSAECFDWNRIHQRFEPIKSPRQLRNRYVNLTSASRKKTEKSPLVWLTSQVGSLVRQFYFSV